MSLYTDEGNFSQYSSVNSCGSIECLELEDSEDIQAIKEDYVPRDDHQEARMCVIVKRKDGSQFELLPALESVVAYFREGVYASA